jgi:hypothetical protein
VQEHQNSLTLRSLFLPTYRIMASFLNLCRQCRTCVPSLRGRVSGSFLCIRCEERNHIPLADQTHDRCSTCKRIRPVYDFPLDRNNYRTASCATCLARLRDSYREQKGEPVLEERRARQLTQAKRVVEKALQARIQGEKKKKRWLDKRKQWKQGDEFLQAT